MKRLLTLLSVLVLVGCAQGYGVTTSNMALHNTYLVKPYVPKAELIMIYNSADLMAYQFQREVPLQYDLMPEGYFVPLVEMDINAPAPYAWWKRVNRRGQVAGWVTGWPTFILWTGSRENGHELARFEGYKDMESFMEQVRLFISMYNLKQ